MMKLISICLLFLTIIGFNLYAQVSCEVYMDEGPLNRSTGFGEERINSGVYEALAQRYNNIDGNITSVTFWGRANPTAGSPSNTVRVRIYYLNPGAEKPSVVVTNGSTTVSVDSSSSVYEVTAFFSPPVKIADTNIVVSIEPSFPGSDDFYIRRNNFTDGQGNGLILIKQAGQWFNHVDLTGPSFDFDFLVLPVRPDTVTADFSNVINNDTVIFSNQSTGGSSYFWDFGDGQSSVLESPTHIYGISDTYNVMLKTFSGDTSCFDSVSSQVIVIIDTIGDTTSINGDHLTAESNDLFILENLIDKSLTIYSQTTGWVSIYDVRGVVIYKEIAETGINRIDISGFAPGVYIIVSENSNSKLRFVKR